MYKSSMQALLGVLLLCSQSLAGWTQKVLRGIVTDNVTNEPVAALNVYTDFGPSSTTNANGLYTLTISGAAFKPGDRITLYTGSTEYGNGKVECIISHDYAFNFSIPKNSAKRFVVGTVKDASTDAPLTGIHVSAIADDADLKVPIVITDAFGKFNIPINRYQLRDNRYVHLLVRDPSNRHMLPGGNPKTVNINAPIVVEMQANAAPPVTLRVKGFKETSINVLANDVVTIEASGSMRLGQWVGTSSPDGIERGVLGLPLDDYNLVKTIHHGALMYRLEGERDWNLVGKRVRFISPRNGNLQFQVNDNQQNDNSGEYEIRVIIERY